MHRLFVALRPPRPVRAALVDMMGGIPGARWQDDDRLHCTLRFIGEVGSHLADDLAATLGTVRHPAVELRLDGHGTFASGGRIHSLWVGLAPISALSGLHASVGRALERAGVDPERRAFCPHITLARFSQRDAPPPEIAMRPLPAAMPPLRFTDFGLYESRLTRDGATYDLVERYPLRD